jgi:hypothetical protein
MSSRPIKVVILISLKAGQDPWFRGIYTSSYF